MTGAWLGTVSAEHVRRGVEQGIAQIGHGKRSGLRRMAAGDWLVYYSPTEVLHQGPPLRSFTAIGRVHDDVLWQGDEGEFRPWRRRIDYVTGARPVPVRDLQEVLDLTAVPNWGYQLRRGLIPLSERDLRTIAAAMGAGL
ncbi:EVE domain-containing protein [Nakamurella endophytica]|uniref:UPF0310 protein GCM10011594_07390 n=1 Tax=Nakamurella endophytica TaxID=1748367 RepID=A0A917SN43_9ACTN|nr:EVE domain-containing protein [Nakamurella endophytica]GGL90237.1 UPF0310 protein [Nakamurella endophytica]